MSSLSTAATLARHKERRQELARLSPRQREVLRYICNGLTYAEIAVELGISLSTVVNHGKTVLKRLGARHRGEVIAIALGRQRESPLCL